MGETKKNVQQKPVFSAEFGLGNSLTVYASLGSQRMALLHYVGNRFIILQPKIIDKLSSLYNTLDALRGKYSGEQNMAVLDAIAAAEHRIDTVRDTLGIIPLPNIIPLPDSEGNVAGYLLRQRYEGKQYLTVGLLNNPESRESFTRKVHEKTLDDRVVLTVFDEGGVQIDGKFDSNFLKPLLQDVVENCPYVSIQTLARKAYDVVCGLTMPLS